MTPKQLIKHYGSIRAASYILGFTRAAIASWKRANRIPPRTQELIEMRSAGKLKANGAKP